MTEQDVRNVFRSKIRLNAINLGNSTFVNVDTFANLFQAAPTVPTFTNLMAIDGGTKGYESFFTECRNEGIIQP